MKTNIVVSRQRTVFIRLVSLTWSDSLCSRTQLLIASAGWSWQALEEN
ncbi:hypothetical protein KZX50_25330 [Bacillus infantis]|nr:hypothetical protein [Bacillus infantis]MCK6208737.1 hypothetical protein [Bacillus infantis]